MNKAELERAIEDEIESFWPGVSVEFVAGTRSGNPKAKLRFEGMVIARPYPSTPSDSRHGVHKCLADMRRVMRQLGAERAKPDPSPEEDEKRYTKPNEGAKKRPDPVAREPVDPKPDVTDHLVRAGAATPEQAETARAERVAPWEDDDESEADSAAELERLRAIVASIQDGIYFHLPAEVYHAVPRLSASGIQKILVSPATFWKDSWLNPDKPDLDEEATAAQILGKAYHVARLEPHLFEDLYCRKPDRADYPQKGTVWNGTQIGEALKEIYGASKKIAGESVAEQAQRLEDCGFDHPIWPLIEARFEAARGTKIPIPAKYYDEIVRDMERLRGSAEIAELLTNGEAEVSIFWTDRYGIRMKARTDFLKIESWADLKTFDNSRGKQLAQALSDNVRYNRLHVQAVVYREAVEAIRTAGLQIMGEATDHQRAMIAAIQIRPDELAMWFIFQEKNGVPNLLARRFPFRGLDVYREAEIEAFAREDMKEAAREALMTKTGLYIRGIQDIDHAKREFMLYSQVYSPGVPWAPINPVASFQDIDFNHHWLEGRYE